MPLQALSLIFSSTVTVTVVYVTTVTSMLGGFANHLEWLSYAFRKPKREGLHLQMYILLLKAYYFIIGRFAFSPLTFSYLLTISMIVLHLADSP
ncbi:MAG TPA: hypothetical protein VKR53_09085 [Puia sp.]|nr:hypothetical protein [Puia sp.]